MPVPAYLSSQMPVTILDGGTGRELKALGAPFRQPEWSALALLEPAGHAFVSRVHERFAAAGAAVITTNSYAVVPFHLGAEVFQARGAELAALAGRLAREAADAANASGAHTGGGGRVRVAGSLPPIGGSYRADLFDASAARPVLEALVAQLAPSVDLWLAETLSCTAEARLVREVIGARGSGGSAATDKPLWLSFTLVDGEEGHGGGGGGADSHAPAASGAVAALRGGESVEEAVAAAAAAGAQAVLFNCSMPEVMAGAVTAAVAAARGTCVAHIGVYANGFAPMSKTATANAGYSTLRKELTPELYLGFARDWAARGASIIGGCCGIGAEHIKALSEAAL